MGVCCCANSKQTLEPNFRPQFKQKPIKRKMVKHQQRLEEILDFWFRDSDDPQKVQVPNKYDRESTLPKKYMKRWFKSSDEFDILVQQNFTDDFKRLEKGEYKEWEQDHHGRLALIILCDQLSRFCFRNVKQAFQYDPIALKLSK